MQCQRVVRVREENEVERESKEPKVALAGWIREGFSEEVRLSKDLKSEGEQPRRELGEECSRLGKQPVQGPWGRFAAGGF